MNVCINVEALPLQGTFARNELRLTLFINGKLVSVCEGPRFVIVRERSRLIDRWTEAEAVETVSASEIPEAVN